MVTYDSNFPCRPLTCVQRAVDRAALAVVRGRFTGEKERSRHWFGELRTM